MVYLLGYDVIDLIWRAHEGGGRSTIGPVAAYMAILSLEHTMVYRLLYTICPEQLASDIMADGVYLLYAYNIENNVCICASVNII